MRRLLAQTGHYPSGHIQADTPRSTPVRRAGSASVIVNRVQQVPIYQTKKARHLLPQMLPWTNKGLADFG